MDAWLSRKIWFITVLIYYLSHTREPPKATTSRNQWLWECCSRYRSLLRRTQSQTAQEIPLNFSWQHNAVFYLRCEIGLTCPAFGFHEGLPCMGVGQITKKNKKTPKLLNSRFHSRVNFNTAFCNFLHPYNVSHWRPNQTRAPCSMHSSATQTAPSGSCYLSKVQGRDWENAFLNVELGRERVR